MKTEHEPHWPSVLATLSIVGLYAALPDNLLIGPAWLPLGIALVCSVPIFFYHRKGKHGHAQSVSYLLLSVLTLFLVFSIALLISALPQHSIEPVQLLRSAVLLWVTNILIFANWYWRLDAGGPHIRAIKPEHVSGAFLFQPMMLDVHVKERLMLMTWKPLFVDYLYLSFNTSAAFSTTDTAPISRWAKILMIVQAGVSLTIITLLAARSVNIL